MPSYSVRRQRIKEFKDICAGASDSIAQTVLEQNAWNVQTAINHFFNNRHLYPELKQGNKSKLTKLWKDYADKEDPSIMSEHGMLQFFKDCGVNPESHETLAIAWHLQSSEMGLFQKEEFINGFSKSGCSDKKDIRKQIAQVCRSLSDSQQFKAFYKWVFHHVKEDDKKKTVPTELAIQLWQIVLQKHKNQMPLLRKWLEYASAVQDSEMKVISRDVWEQIYEFLKETKSIKDFDEMSAWPVAIDEFVEYLNAQK
eukprot:28456_1